MACLGRRAGAAGRFCATVGGCTGGGCRWQGGTWIYTRRGDGRHKRCPITRWLWPNVFNAITLPTLCTITNGCMTCLSHPRHVQEHACPDICALARSNVARASPSGPSVVHILACFEPTSYRCPHLASQFNFVCIMAWPRRCTVAGSRKPEVKRSR